MVKDPLRKIVDLDLLIHTPARLAILIFLIPRGTATFPEISEALKLTSGNLSSHSKKLKSAELVEIEKTFIVDKPTTILHITGKGRDAIIHYSKVLQSALKQIK